jgi:hypothetical protein
VSALLDQAKEGRMDVVVIDPEGEFDKIPGTIALGDAKAAPILSNLDQLLEKPALVPVLNLIGVSLPDRAAFTADIMPRLVDICHRYGRPHWIILDEAHHLFAPALTTSSPILNIGSGLLFVTSVPSQFPDRLLDAIDTVCAVGAHAKEVLRDVARKHSRSVEMDDGAALELGQGLFWRLAEDRPHIIELPKPKQLHQRHKRKYMAGHLGEDNSFYFRGKDRKLNLRADNLETFLNLADGVDDETWLHHLHNGDVSRWFNDTIKDEALAEDVRRFERDRAIGPQDTRQRVRKAVEARYTAGG